MRKNIMLWAIISSLCFFTACDEVDTEGISVEYSFDLTDGADLIVQLGDAYTDPGYKATYDGANVTDKVVVEGIVDPNIVGFYKVKYTYTPPNGAGIPRERQVIVSDKSITTDISGKYTTQDGTHRIRDGARTDYSGIEVEIEQIAPGFFSVSNLIGGYYSDYVGYGARYAAAGYVQLKADNSISVLSSSVLGWGDSLDFLNNAAYTPADNTIYWEAGYAGMVFYVNIKIKEE
ncbi:BT_2262 family domain-containing protein [Labilibaculum antarcticum]|uniref:Pesticidal crystal protein Cry22Aa Ig-like domain-containing protein n=1 Tax=Labilibaculum antarcticum TaxID=1717717 RepID=A0A1Y1CJK9_9BACT|nr:BT_2262 family domain-containing protein [Labilibaculum antarcticum]BAX79461.1 hypothetical protein ALGA_1075 [Labilibaculum antarcticum]